MLHMNGAMFKLITYLQDSELVARFQRTCGLFAVKSERRRTCGNGHLQVDGTEDRSCTSDYTYQANGYNVDAASGPQYQVRNVFLYYLFLVSAALGREVFYISFLPCVHWNLDPFLCRRLVNMWAVVMYIGQVLKDTLKMPRPLAPPVVRLETRVSAEYGMPSTHAMAATTIFFTFLFSATHRFQIQFESGLLLAVLLSILVCLSRLYTGMHSVLDVIGGVLISAVLMLLTYPAWDAFERVQLTSPLTPVVSVVLPFLLSYCYPKLDHYSTTRGDTTIILGVGAGCSAGYWLNQQLGQTSELKGPFPLPLPPLTPRTLALGCARSTLGVAVLLGTRQLAKSTSLWALCTWHQVSPSDPLTRRRREIEVPYKFSTYTAMGLVHTILLDRAFRQLGLL
ncbi:sphingosine-1-phosphate phosphatase 2 isoform X1 [Conger conger]|uniref:sphingosine-1-phosphate phosphatase 2 isoform X1 n=2 Tax=Conger conger TaxID=82655 RepID=UPI002A599E6B|nr:sphingosine-1-phosphate phosphatase 2 isoform X1 [Conger conger]